MGWIYFFRAIKYFLDDAIVLPPGQLEDPNLLKSLKAFQREVDRKKMAIEMKQKMDEKKDERNPLDRSGKLFGAMWADIKRRFTIYKSDLVDGFNTQCLGRFS